MDSIPPDADRDLTAGALIVQDERVLLLKHVKLDCWLHPGGHVEENELLHETAKRETLEETGYRVDIVPRHERRTYDNAAYDLPIPLNVNVHRIEDGHWHCDFTYLATVNEKTDATHADEHGGIKWFTRKELRDEQFDMPENVRANALQAIEEA